jgi:DNA-binding transcriptional ArsR family regulator
MKNRPRSQRDPDETVRKVGSRHQKILIAIERYGLLDTKHLCLITGLHQKNIEFPLRQLFDAGLIERLPNNQFNRDRLKDPQVYKKADLGTDWLERHGLTPYRAIWVAAGGQASHNLKVCLALACIEAAITAAGLRFYAWEELLADAPEETRKLKSPHRFSTSNGHIVPDAIFSVATKDDYRRLFFLEVDLSDHGEKAYRAKADAYRELIFRGIYKAHLDMEQYANVITITTAPSRQKMMVSLTEKRDPSYFKVMPEYGSFEIAPSPSLSILEDWHCLAKPEPLNLMETV